MRAHRAGRKPATAISSSPPRSAASSTHDRLTDTAVSRPFIRRERRTTQKPPVNAKRVYRLMAKHGLLLQRHSGRRRARNHDGQVATRCSNVRWCSDGLEFTCWNGEVVRVAFALDCHDREVIAWVATTAGISGEMIRDLMVTSVERRFATSRAPHRVQWLSDNGSPYAAAENDRHRVGA